MLAASPKISHRHQQDHNLPKMWIRSCNFFGAFPTHNSCVKTAKNKSWSFKNTKKYMISDKNMFKSSNLPWAFEKPLCSHFLFIKKKIATATRWCHPPFQPVCQHHLGSSTASTSTWLAACQVHGTQVLSPFLVGKLTMGFLGYIPAF